MQKMSQHWNVSTHVGEGLYQLTNFYLLRPTTNSHAIHSLVNKRSKPKLTAIVDSATTKLEMTGLPTLVLRVLCRKTTSASTLCCSIR